MTDTSGTSAGKRSEQTVVVLELPGRLEYAWPSPRAVASWQIGACVWYMGNRWRVVSRANGVSDVLTLRLAPEA